MSRAPGAGWDGPEVSCQGRGSGRDRTPAQDSVRDGKQRGVLDAGAELRVSPGASLGRSPTLSPRACRTRRTLR